MDNYIGRLLDNRYEILEVIGTGGMAVVYKALCHRLNRLVAVKILKDEFSKDPDFHRRFLAESQAVAMLSHPNIVSVYDVSQDGAIDYIVMELIEGITMKQYLDKKGAMTWREVLHFSMQIAKGLEHAHSRGIIHRDIKPHNIMVLKDGSVKVADFGIARIASAQSTLTREALGSVHYISPEQAKGGRVDNRTDIYSLGVVMYQMLTGRPPYDGESPVAVAIQHINGNLLPPSQLNSQIPRGLEQIIMRAMALNPDDRYNSATELLRDMEEFRRNPAIIFPRVGDIVPPRVEPVRKTAETPRQASPRQSQTPSQTPPSRPAQNIAEQKAGYAPDRVHKKTEPEPEKKNIAAVVAIAVCAVVLIGAIILFASLHSCNNTPENPSTPSVNEDLHTIPKFVGMQYSAIRQSDYPYLTFEMEEENSDEEKGKVVRQSLEANAEIKGNRTILLTVSLGPKTETLIDLSRRSREDAENWLLALKMNISIGVKLEHDDEVEDGKVIRTDPPANSTIAAGDAVTLYISSGKEPVQVPKVIGMSISEAYNLLTNEKYNFKVEHIYQEDEADKDTVIGQSLAQGTEAEQGASITLTVSDGPAETEPSTEPSTEPTEPPEPSTEPTEPSTEPPTEPEPRTITYPLTLDPMEQDANVEIRQSNTIIATAVLPAGQTEVELSLTGTGTQYYDVYINGTYQQIIRVKFDE